MTYSVNFYDKDRSSIHINDDRAELLKKALVSNAQWINIKDDLIASSSISSVTKNAPTIQYKQLPEPEMRFATNEKVAAARKHLIDKLSMRK